MVRQLALVLLVAVIVAGRPALAQQVAETYKTERRLSPPLGCDRVTVADGLPHTNVRAMVQDNRGFMWFGTADGLARYDGTRMRVYRHAEFDVTSISSSFISSLGVDATGKLWIGTLDSGLNVYDPSTDKFKRYGKDDLSSKGVIAISRDRKDRMWFAMSEGGLNRFEPATSNFTEYLAKPLDVPITAISADGSGNLWLGTTEKRIIRWNPDTGSTASFDLNAGDEANEGIKSILAATSGKIWVGTDGDGLFELDPATGKMLRHRHAAADPSTITDDRVSVLFEDKQKVVWIGTLLGLNRMDPTGSLVRFQYDVEDRNNPSNLSFPEVASIYQDSGGVMWAGGFTAGACKFDETRRQFGLYRTGAHALAYFEDIDGTLWVGTYGGGLHKIEAATHRVTIYKALGKNRKGGESLPLAGVWITSLQRDRSGTLWVGMKEHGLVAFDTKAETYKQYLPDPDDPDSLPVNTLFDMWEDPAGMLWLATWGGGLVRLDPATEKFTVMAAAADDQSPNENALTSNALYFLYPDPTDPQILWLGTANGGLVRFNIANNGLTAFRNREDDPTSLSMDDVTAIYREPTGTMWVGTYGAGLNRLDLKTGKAERFTISNSGLTNNIVFAILPGAEGTLWLATNGGGLVHLDPKTKKFLSYGPADGVQDNEFAQGSAMLGRSGKLYVGGLGGFNAFMPQAIKRDTYVPPLVATAFMVFNQEVPLDRPIWTLPSLEVSYTDRFEVQFAALAFAAPDKNRYAYKLEGYDDDFIETPRPFAPYARVDGGNYTLRVKSANRHDVWNETGFALKLKVTPPVWRTLPAYFVYLLLLGAAAYLVMRIQREKVRRAQREGRLAMVERDLELTGIVQTGFLPAQEEIQTKHLQLCGLYKPADACGGDWWWHEMLSGGRHVIMVGDVTGHGPGPAMVTAAVATAFRVMIEQGLDDVQEGLEMLNRQVLRVAQGKYHMTMAALEIEETTGRWTLYNAGAPPMLSLGQNGKHRVHFCPGAPLGTETGFETGRLEGQLQPTERILLYTDGIPEIEYGKEGAVMGMRRFAQHYERTRGEHLRQAADAVLEHAALVLGNGAQTDDWTFTMLEWN